MFRVRIDTEGQADALTRSVMEEVAEEYRDALGTLVCPEHGTGPTVTVYGRTPDTIAVSVETCCEQLQRLVDDTLEED